MSRPLEFRVWDYDKKEMIYYDNIWGNIAPWTENSAFPQYESIKKLHTISDVMQFTGLYDVNCKKIFECDIVKIEKSLLSNYDFPVEEEILIEFRNYGWFPFDHGCPSPDSLEVIGNIFENPELITS